MRAWVAMATVAAVWLAAGTVGTNQFSLGAPLAIARDTVYFVSNDNDDQHSNVYALTVP